MSIKIGKRAIQNNPISVLKKILSQVESRLESTAQNGFFQGRVKTIKTAKGTKLNTVFALIDIDRVIASHTAAGAENPQYPQELQPRDRSRDSSQAWVQKTANDIDPDSLGMSGRADTGAPIVGDDLVVESGNGRTMALKLAYERGTADEYKAWLETEAEYFGFSHTQVQAIQKPMLVRMRTTPIDRAQFAIEANQDDKLSFTATERAKADAKRIDDQLTMLFSPSEDGDLLSASNHKFLTGFMAKLGDTESAQYRDRDGNFTQAFATRVKQAIFAKAYNDDRLLEMMADHSKPEMQNMINALTASAPKFIEAQAASRAQVEDVASKIVDGIEQSLDQKVMNAIIDATNAILAARRNNQEITEFIKQQGLFTDLHEGVPELAVFIAENNRSAKKLAVFFEAIAEYVEKTGLDSQNLGLFGEPEPISVGDAVQYALQTYQNHFQNKKLVMFDDLHLGNREINLDEVTEVNPLNALAILHAIYADLLEKEIGQETLAEQGLSLSQPNNPYSIQDLGEKIGGARKDTAMKGMKKSRTSANLDSRPGWMRRFNIVEIVAGNGAGTWEIIDTRKKHWNGGAVTVARGFSSETEAEMAIPLVAVSQKHRIYRAAGENRDKFAIYRNINDRKRVQIVETLFNTEEEAKLYMVLHAKDIIETNSTFGEVDIPKPENTVRQGPEYRQGNADGQDFMNTFGLRGVEFGNWNNQSERQELLNDAFDGLMDLSTVLGVSPKAISLNGDLALAFGARGQGLSGAAAHYERSRAVINLTKKNGAGSLAHEWLHALDHHLGRLDGRASSDWNQHNDGTRSLKIDETGYRDYVSHGFSYNSKLDPEVIEAHKKLMKVLSYKDQQVAADTEGAEKFVNEAKDRVKSKLDEIRAYLLRQLDPKYYKRLNKPASEKQIAEFDVWANKILSAEMLETEARKNPNARSAWGFRQTNDALDAINNIMKAIRGRQGFANDGKGTLDYLRSYMSGYRSRLEMLKTEQSSDTKTKQVVTDFKMDANRLDSGRLGSYWQLDTEMLARAFQGYIEDKVKEKQGYSPFLNYGPEGAALITPWGVSFVFPRGEERKRINQAFDELFELMRRKGILPTN
ncbi:LPD1 domain-containing protein [Acinetobacter sp. MB5]|uniref:LPD1 domain-containing protein n=1 Tax=Acinetobacter sp. MB5 TaxID=2069438 RepID=UPI0013A70A63|nr:LPD1 domain-containing protein [Acinetobacter sp. MB5]